MLTPQCMTEANITDLFEIVVGLFFCSRENFRVTSVVGLMMTRYPTSAQICAYFSRVEREPRSLGAAATSVRVTHACSRFPEQLGISALVFRV